MAELKEPKLGTTNAHQNITRIFTEVCNGVTIMVIYGIIWMMIGILGYKLFQWIM